MKALYNFILLILILPFNIQVSMAQSHYNKTSIDSINLDDSIRYGRLSNGFTYYIKSLKAAQERLHLNFYVKAGFNLEDELQEEVAHGVEHLAFEPSVHYPKGLFNTLDAWKYKFNGSCGPRITEYRFNPPTRDIHVIDSALLWFQDIADGLYLTTESIESVKAVLAQEFVFRVGQNSDYSKSVTNLHAGLFPARRSSDDFLIKLKQIKDKDVIRFYENWYQPSLMAISIVGNINNVDSLEARIAERFSNIPKKDNPRTIPDFDSIYYNSPPQFTKVVKSLDSLTYLSSASCEIRMFYRAPSILKELTTMVGVRNLLRLELLNDILNKRLKEQITGYNSFRVVSSVPFALVGLPPVLCIAINTDSAPVKESIRKTMSIIEQLQYYGVKKEEWEKCKNQRLAQMDSTLTEKFDYWVQEIVKHFKYGETIPKGKQQKLKKWLTSYKLTEFNNFIKDFLSEPPMDIGLIIPPEHEALSYTEKEIRLSIKSALNSLVNNYEPIESQLELMPKEKIRNLKLKDYQLKGVKKSGEMVLKLVNGVKIILRPFKPLQGAYSDKIMVHGFSPNGASCLPRKDYYSTVLATSIVENSGVGSMDKFKLKQIFSGTSIFAKPYIGVYEAGISGNSSLNELPKLLQLIYLYFTDPRKSQEAFEDWKVNEQKYFNQTSNFIRKDLYNTIGKFTGDTSFPRSSFTPIRYISGTKRLDAVGQCELDKAYANYKTLFNRAEDFTFIVSGNFSIDSILPSIQKYLGNLPNKETVDCSKVQIRNENLLRGPICKEISSPKFHLENTKYALRFYSKVKTPYNWKEEIKIKLLIGILERMAWGLRFEKGYSFYYLGTFASYNHHMKRVELEINIDCNKKDLSKIKNEFKRIVSNIKEGIISTELVASQFGVFLEDYSDLNSRTQRQVQYAFYKKYRFGVPMIDPRLIQRYVKSLTIEDVVSVANKYFQDENLFEFVMKN